MWAIWSVSRTTRQAPSQLLHIGEWAAELAGMPYDEWTPFQFDAAVSYFGVWVENKLNQFDKKSGKPLHKLEDLLDGNETKSWSSFFAALGVKVWKA